ncbi:MAG: hypothetical protein LBN38_04310 [Verrucomicrobiota bacterium]|nr:hypothetical protein [Verrucomicrobiota bacterium]
MKTMHSFNPHSGYSLVEVTLALLVVAVGLTATFALFPEGLKATRSAVDDVEVGLFADYVFSTLAVTAAAQGLDGGNLSAAQGNKYASRVLSDRFSKEKQLVSGNALNQFYWIARNYDHGTGDWDLASSAGYASAIFTYQLEWKPMYKGNNRDTFYAVLKVWPGEWQTMPSTNFQPYVFYREVVPYPNM